MEKDHNEGMKGIVLNVFKRKLFHDRSDLNIYDNILMGFYDGIVFTHPKTWFDFGPDGVDRLLGEAVTGNVKRDDSGGVDWKKSFSEIYPIKLLFPRAECCQIMEEDYGFNFSYWESASAGKQPLFAVLLINVTKEFIVKTSKEIDKSKDKPDGSVKNKKCPEYRLSLVAKNVWDAIKSIEPEGTKEKISKLNCGLFQCIGYYDYALMFAGNDWDMVYKIANKLKSWNISENMNEPEYFVFNNYLMLGMNARTKQWEEIINKTKCEVSVQINLRGGRSAEDFHKDFIKIYRSQHDKEPPDLLEKYVRFYQINGGADCLLTTETSSEESNFGMYFLFRELSEGGLLTPSKNNNNGFFNNYISGIQTTVRRILNEDDARTAKLTCNDNTTDNTASELYDLLREMEKTVKFNSDSAFIRRSRALWQQIAQYENLIGENHAFDIQAVLKPAYAILLKNLKDLVKIYKSMQNSNEDAVDGTSSAVSKNITLQHAELHERVNKLLTEFLSKVGDFQNTLQLSDPHFIESARINHHSLGSSTKLLLTYSYLLNCFAKDIVGIYSQQCIYQVLLSCDVDDYTRSWNISRGIYTNSTDNRYYRAENDLVFMSIPERSLLDIRGTLLRSVHELWHFCGERMRKERYSFIVNDAAYRIAKVMGCVLFDYTILASDILNNNLDYILMPLEERNKKEIEIKNMIKENNRIFNENLQKILVDAVMEKTREAPSNVCDFYYGDRIFNFLKNTIADMFVNREDSDDTMWKKIYDCYEEQCIKLYDRAQELCGSQLIHDIQWKLKYRKDDKEPQIDSKIKATIQNVLNHMTGNNITANTKGKQKYEKALEQLLEANSINDIFELLGSVYRETFSDNMTCVTLNCTMEEYILGFVYENPDVTQSLAPVPRRIMRIGAILEHRYSCKDEQLCLNRKALKKLCEEMFDQPYTDARVENIESSVNKIWNLYYNNDKKYVANLSKYLEKTEGAHNGIKELDSRKLICNLYSKARDMNTHEGVMNTIQTLMQSWSKMANA